MSLSLHQHIAGLVIAGLYYWLMDDELGAQTCWEAGAAILPMIFKNTQEFKQ